MQKFNLILILAFLTIILAACSSSGTDAQVKAVENYLNALVNKESDRIPSLVCGDWESVAMIEVDSFQAVTARLEDVTCSQTGIEGDTTLVHCTGSIATTYNNEDTHIDLSVRTYEVVEQSGDWLVCGTR